MNRPVEKRLVNLTQGVIDILDAELGIVGQFGRVMILVAHGRCDVIETTRSTKILDALVGREGKGV